MLVDRALQLELLRRLADTYPTMTNVQSWEPNETAVARTLYYLHEHDLVEIVPKKDMNAPTTVLMAKINARGLDFLADDGGLSAILGVVTVRFEAETLRALIGAKIDAAPITAEEKSRLKEHLLTMSSEALKTVTKSLVEAALKHSPDVIQLLSKALGS